MKPPASDAMQLTPAGSDSQSVTAGRTDLDAGRHRGVDHAARLVQVDPAQQALTGPIEAGRIDSVRKPMAARQSASIGRPASSPQKDSGVLGLGAAGDDVFEKAQERQVQRVIAAAHQFVLAVGGEEELLQVIAADRDEIGQLEEGLAGA